MLLIGFPVGSFPEYTAPHSLLRVPKLLMMPRLLSVPKLLMMPELLMAPELTNTIPELMLTESPKLIASEDTVQVSVPFQVPEIGADSHDV